VFFYLFRIVIDSLLYWKLDVVFLKMIPVFIGCLYWEGNYFAVLFNANLFLIIIGSPPTF